MTMLKALLQPAIRKLVHRFEREPKDIAISLVVDGVIHPVANLSGVRVRELLQLKGRKRELVAYVGRERYPVELGAKQ